MARVAELSSILTRIAHELGTATEPLDTLPDQVRTLRAASQANIDLAEARKARVAELEGELERWPRVFWVSADPKSLAEGYRVVSVDAQEGDVEADGWHIGILVDTPDEGEVWAPADFGLYPTPEAAESARQGGVG